MGSWYIGTTSWKKFGGAIGGWTLDAKIAHLPQIQR